MAAAAGAFPPHEVVGRYWLRRQLGAGTFGSVHEADDRTLGRRVALKLVRPAGPAAAAEEALDAFEAQVRLSARLRHPNIVAIYDVGHSEDFGYVAMELLSGTTLERLLAREKRLPVARAAALAAQVADALDAAHAQGLVHRDIKPANIMVDASDGVKVTDFGLARSVATEGAVAGPHPLEGTPPYMSPEQARGLAVDGRSDLFSLGCVVYEMVAGERAFAADSITALLFEIITAAPRPLRDRNPTLPPALDRIVARALAKEPGQRYPRGAAFARDLRALASA